jgi:hypothetical protein
MTKIDIITYIDYLRNTPAALSTVNNTKEKNMTDGIINVLTWALRFVEFFNTAFRTKDGEYRKSGWLKAIGIATAVFKLGLDLINIKKRTL